MQTVPTDDSTTECQIEPHKIEETFSISLDVFLVQYYQATDS